MSTYATSADAHIVIVPTGIRGERGQRYYVLYAGEVLTEDTWNPEHDAARALLALGISGKIEVWRDDKVASVMDIDGAAKLTIAENAQAGPKVVRFVPFSPGWVASPAAVSGRPGEPADEDGLW